MYNNNNVDIDPEEILISEQELIVDDELITVSKQEVRIFDEWSKCYVNKKVTRKMYQLLDDVTSKCLLKDLREVCTISAIDKQIRRYINVCLEELESQ